jgi:aldehyde dehydrogenase (NAD+)
MSHALPATTVPVTLDELIQRQDQYFQSGATRGYEFRREQLQKLLQVVRRHERDILEALARDLRKHETEAYLAEIGIVYAELSDALKHLKRWMKPRKVGSPLTVFPARSRIVPEPLGRSLIISPWNYPYQLTIAPLIGAIAAGNVAVIKPSELAPQTALLLEKLINENFAPEYLHVLNGGVELSQQLLDRRWDHIFFTGSTAVGKLIAAAAAKHLTPCTLELGGKSPCLVSRKANLEVTARRIIFGKFLNAGQTCVAPDYILVEDPVHDPLIEALRKEISLRFGPEPLRNEQLPRIINERHFQRLQRLIDPAKVNFGGRSDPTQLLIEPTLMTGVQPHDPVMQEEIFGPVLPIIAVKNLEQAKKFILGFEKPLALYLFSDDAAEQRDIIGSVSFGGGCINDTLMHLANPELPFGGVGASGMGSYHGQHSFDAFSHKKAVLVNGTALDLPVRYFPWIPSKEKVLRLLLK